MVEKYLANECISLYSEPVGIYLEGGCTVKMHECDMLFDSRFSGANFILNHNDNKDKNHFIK